MDQTIEETINKDTQTAGGTKGLSTKANAIARYYITANNRANYVCQCYQRKTVSLRILIWLRKNHMR